MKCRIQFFLLLLCLILPFGTILKGQPAQETCVIQGYVRDSATQQPMVGIGVSINGGHSITTTSDSNGFFSIVRKYRNVYSLMASGKNVCSPVVTIDMSAQDTANVVLLTNPCGEIQISVTDINQISISKPTILFSEQFPDGMRTYYYYGDTNGKYTVSNLDLNVVIPSIQVLATGFQSTTQTNIQFPLGQNQLSLTFALTSSSNDSSITVSGDVKDSSDNPISPATVSNSANSYSMPGQTYKSTTTDSNGLFQLKDVPPYNNTMGYGNPNLPTGNLAFFVTATGYAPTWKQMTSPQDTVLHIVMSPSHYVAGKVVDSDGNPLEKVWGYVNVQPSLEGNIQYSGMYNWGKNFVSDSVGQFRVDDLSDNLSYFRFNKDGYTPVQNTTLFLDRDDIVITLYSTGDIAGSVVDDQTGKPISSFKIMLGASTVSQDQFRGRNVNVPYEYSQKGVSFNAEDGKFAVSKLALNQNLRVMVNVEGYRQEEIDPVPVRVGPLKEADKLVFRMKKSSPTLGIVQQKNSGFPIPGAIVTAIIPQNQNFGMNLQFNWDTSNKMNFGYTIIATTTDAQGRFQFDNLPITVGNMALEKQGFGRTIQTQVDFTRFVVAILPRAASITVLMTPSTDSVSANMQKNDNMQFAMYETKSPDTAGKIVYTDLPPGSFYLNISKNKSNSSHPITLAEGQNYVLDLTSTANIKVSGTVKYKGAPAQQININAYNPDSPQSGGASAQGDQDGHYDLYLSQPGKYQINFHKSIMNGRGGTWININKTLTVSSGDYKLDVNLPDSAIKGLVLNPKTGKPITDVPIAAYIKKTGDERQTRSAYTEYTNPGWNLYNTTTTNDNGLFAMENMEAGEWLVAEEKEPGNASPGKPFQLTVNQTKDNIVLMEPEKGSLEIKVLDEDSGNFLIPNELGCADSTGYIYQPEFAKSTSLIANPFIARQVATDSTGKIIFSSIPAGTYKVYARTQEHYTDSTTLEVFSGKTTLTTLKLKKGGRFVFSLKEKKDLGERDSVYCIAKILRAKDAMPIMQDAAGNYKKTSFFFSTKSQDICSIPLPAGDYTVELRTNYYSQKIPNMNRTPSTITKLLKVEQGKDTVWEISIANLSK